MGGKVLFSLHLDPSHPCYDIACIILYDRSLQFAIIQKNKKEILFTDFFYFMMYCFLLRVTKQIVLGERQSTLTVHNVFLFFRPFFTLI